ncbi:MAG: hypothetical protein HC905_16225 [Bacteroidales bacterium]|nr:hypothetical protein [Bacteroidales bacterium]
MKSYNINTRILICLLLAGFLFFSCTKYPDPSTELVASYNFITTGSNQRGLAGEFLADTTGIKIVSNGLAHLSYAKVIFELPPNNGSVNRSEVTVNVGQTASVRWKLGATANKQQLLARVFDETNTLIGTVPLYGYAFRKNVWDTVTSSYENFRDMIVDSVNNTTLLVSGALYRQKCQYF